MGYRFYSYTLYRVTSNEDEVLFNEPQHAPMVRVKATVISQEGHCAAGHKVGDQIIFDWDTHEIEGRLCLHALYSVMPKVYGMAMGGNVAFAEAEDGTLVARHACPDGYNPLILELRIID